MKDSKQSKEGLAQEIKNKQEYLENLQPKLKIVLEVRSAYIHVYKLICYLERVSIIYSFVWAISRWNETVCKCRRKKKDGVKISLYTEMHCEFTCHAGVEFMCDVYFNLFT